MGTVTSIKRTVAIRLETTIQQAASLSALQTTFAEACNAVATIAHQSRTANRVRLHHLAYYATRERFPRLGAQMACNAIASVARSMRSHRAKNRDWAPPVFKRGGSVHFDARTFRLFGGTVSLFTMEGREHVTARIGKFQRAYLDSGKIKEAELRERRGRWFLHVAIDLENPEMRDGHFLGVDLGENVAAATSGGGLHGGKALRHKRDTFAALRTRLQRNGSQSARQRLARVSGRESRQVRHANHVISAKIVKEALETGCGTIVMEDLTNIRDRIRVGKRMRTRLHSWAWRQLQDFIAYKAEGAGVAVLYVDPAYTSRTCSRCGTVGSRSGHRFSCSVCGIFAHSDRNAACNLAKIGATAVVLTGDVNHPHVAADGGP